MSSNSAGLNSYFLGFGSATPAGIHSIAEIIDDMVWRLATDFAATNRLAKHFQGTNSSCGLGFLDRMVVVLASSNKIFWWLSRLGGQADVAS